MGAAGADQGAAGRGRRRRSATAFIERAEPFVWPDVLDPDAVHEIRAMKARTEEMLRQQGPRGPRAEARATAASATSSSRCSCSNSCTAATTARSAPRTTLDALEQLAAGGYVTIDDARTLDDGVHLAAHRRAPAAARRRAPDPHAPGRRRRAHAPRAGARVPRPTRRRRASEQFDAEHQRHQAIVRAIHEKLFFAPLLDTLAGVGALSIGGRRGTADRVRLPRRRADPRRAARAHRRAHPPLACDAAAAARDARLAVGRARPRPRAARSCAG